jgi:hypothetical protein
MYALTLEGGISQNGMLADEIIRYMRRAPNGSLVNGLANIPKGTHLEPFFLNKQAQIVFFFLTISRKQ